MPLLTINADEVGLILSACVGFFAVVWSIKKALLLFTHD